MLSNALTVREGLLRTSCKLFYLRLCVSTDQQDPQRGLGDIGFKNLKNILKEWLKKLVIVDTPHLPKFPYIPSNSQQELILIFKYYPLPPKKNAETLLKAATLLVPRFIDILIETTKPTPNHGLQNKHSFSNKVTKHQNMGFRNVPLRGVEPRSLFYQCVEKLVRLLAN